MLLARRRQLRDASTVMRFRPAHQSVIDRRLDGRASCPTRDCTEQSLGHSAHQIGDAALIVAMFLIARIALQHRGLVPANRRRSRPAIVNNQPPVQPGSKSIRSMAKPGGGDKAGDNLRIGRQLGLAHDFAVTVHDAERALLCRHRCRCSTGPPVDATVHRRAAGSVEFDIIGTGRRNDPIQVTDRSFSPSRPSLPTKRFNAADLFAIQPHSRAAQATLGHRGTHAY
jgi:hypothetical protein